MTGILIFISSTRTKHIPILINYRFVPNIIYKKGRHHSVTSFFIAFNYFAALAALMASISSGVTLNRSPQMP